VSTAHLDTLLARLDEHSATIAVVGQGYVGLPVAMRCAEVGFRVWGYELDAHRVAMLQVGESYVGDVPSEQLQAAIARGYRATDQLGDLAGFDVAVISVPTPLAEGIPDLSYVEAASEALARVLRAGAVVILESTTYPGTTEELVRPILESSGLRAGVDFYLGYSPERIDPGNPHFVFTNTPKVVSGIDPDSLRAVDAFFSAIVDKTVPVGSTREAELVKLLENTFRHVNIALVNELAMFANDLGVDIWSAIDAASTKPFGYMRFKPGPGVGGHCLPIDPSYLSWSVKRRSGHPFRFVELANDVNEHMPEYVVRRVQRLLNDRGLAVRGSRILLLGLAYKAGTSDWRESPSIAVAELLHELGAELRAVDPYLVDGVRLDIDLPLVELTADALAASDLVVLLVDHPEFDLDQLCAAAPLLFDTKGVLHGRTFNGEVL
jgi:nucleotide sugar dehydrogenase